MLESGVLYNEQNEIIYLHTPLDRSNVHIADSYEFWQIIWDNRFIIKGFAHSHPGSGLTSPSWTDITTFSSIERGLGKKLEWPIITSDKFVICTWCGPGLYDYKTKENFENPEWLNKLREISNYNKKE